MLKDRLSGKTWLVWVTLSIGLLATIFASLQIKRGIEQHVTGQFAVTCDQVAHEIEENLYAGALVLRGGASLFAASKTVDRKVWRAFFETLQAERDVPGAETIGFAKVIPADELAAHIANTRAEGFPEYTVRPANKRSLYTSIIYIEPLRDRNMRALGFDMFSDPIMRIAMEQARDTGEAALSGKIEQAQDTVAVEPADAFMFIPVYRNGMPVGTVEQRREALLGWVYNPYQINDFMSDILAHWASYEAETVDLDLYEGLQIKPANLLFDSKPDNKPDVHSLFYQQRTINFNGHHWLLVLDHIPALSWISYAPAWAVLIGGFALNGILFVLMHSVINTRANAIRIAEGLTAEIRRGQIERDRAQEAIRENEIKYRTLFETANDGIFLQGETAFLDCNETGARMYGLTKADVIGCQPNALSPERQANGRLSSEVSAEKELAALKGEPQLFEWQSLHSDGSVFDVEITLNRLELSGGVYLQAIVRDITERKQAEDKLQLAASVFTHAREGIMITATDGTIIDVNDAFSDITGYGRDEVLGQNPRFLNSGRQKKKFYTAMWRDLIAQGCWSGEIWNRHKNGAVYAEMLTISAVRDARGVTRHYVALLTDITPLKEHEQKLEQSAYFDALTGLPNRVLLADRLQHAMVQAQRREQRLAVAFIDLDGFKAINDNHGHEAGDQLLITAAARMKQALREGDTFARLGGDEFVAVLLDLADLDACVPMITRLLAAAAQPVYVDELMLQVSASLGVTFYPQAEDFDADQLLRQADQAMYQAKLAGKNRYHIFDAEYDRSVRGHHERLERLRRALTEHEFVLYYQPKVNMRTGTVIGAEALIRWQHPERGLLPPSAFLPAIEDHMLSVELGEWVIDTALTEMELWHAEGLDIPVSVNVGARQLQQADFVDRLREILLAHPNVRPGYLELEVLETSALEDIARISQVIEGCREIGVSFSLDDFGTGYSSLTYLKRLQVTQLKIDQSFVRDMLDSPDDLAILEGVLGMAAAFQRQVIAEGVETVEHGEMLLQFDCELAQGFGIAHPMPGHEMSGWSVAWRTAPSWNGLPALSREDFPLLVASVEHRAWIAAVEAFLRGSCKVLPPMDPHQCRFGMWLDAKGLIRYRAQPALFHAIEQLHRQVHVLGAELLELQARGRSSEALARLGELHGLRDALLKQMKALVLEKQAVDGN